ncbi:hypothetical protein, partial [Burkholderia singularis]|uniref:hypothetical protein n=1 Tax=Burkholderia singularis TaxID=1503053 RepID=UPI001C468712
DGRGGQDRERYRPNQHDLAQRLRALGFLRGRSEKWLIHGAGGIDFVMNRLSSAHPLNINLRAASTNFVSLSEKSK